MATSDNNRFLREWFEVDIERICFGAKTREDAKESGKKWFPYNKGGAYRRWYGNCEHVVNWVNDGEEVLGYADSLYGSPTRPAGFGQRVQRIGWPDPTTTCRSRTAGSGLSAELWQPCFVAASLRQAFITIELTVNRLTGNISFMPIQSFACADTEGLFTTGKSRRFVNIKSVAERKLAQLDAAPSVSFMKAPPGNDLKEYDSAWHVRINDQWRLTFKWEIGRAHV